MNQKNYYDIVVETLLESQNGGKDFLDVSPEEYNNGNKVLSPKEYEILGAISYLHGLAFITQNGEMNKEAMSNFKMRLESTKLTDEDLLNFGELINKLDVKLLYDANIRQQKLVSEISDIDVGNLQDLFGMIVENSIFDISLSEDLKRLQNLNEVSYIDLLKIHKTIFENLNVSGAHLYVITDFLNQPKFSDELNKASFYFDLQKFALISYDSIMSLREYFESEKKIYETYIGIDVETLRSQKDIDIDFVTNNTPPQNTPKVVPQKTEAIDISNTDAFFRAYLMEIHPQQIITEINRPEDIVSALDAILENDDALPKAFQFLRANVDKNRSNLTEIYGFDVTPLIDEFKKRYDDIRTKLKDTMEEYHKEIDKDILPEIVNLLNLTIESLIVCGSENKGYFIQQINENGIFTYKHLHQILSLIEDCEIQGIHYHNYVELVSFIRNNIKITEIFSLANEMDTLQMYVQFNKAVIDFYEYAK